MRKISVIPVALMILTGCATKMDESRLVSYPKKCPEVSAEDHGQGIMLPYYRAVPFYPRIAVEQRLEGFVEFEMDIDENGIPKNISPTKSYPDDVFLVAATKALEKYRYKPKLVDGTPVISQCEQIRISFEFG